MEVPNGHKIIQEGKAQILYPADEDGDVPAFYNPAQVFNRDLSCAVLEEFGILLKQERKDDSDLVVIEALSASGLRACRYSLECAGIGKIIANDLSVSAVAEIKKNAEFNKVGHLVEPNCDDAINLMTMRRSMETNVDVIDLDPYGSACPFLDSAVQAVKHGGLLMVTCTDMAILAGNHPEACWAKYGSMPLKSHFCHEQAIRIVLHAIERASNRYGRYIEPLISLHLDFFIRVFVRVHHGKIHVKKSCSKIGHVVRCPFTHMYKTYTIASTELKNGGMKFSPTQIPPISGIPYAKRLVQAGPYWLSNLHNHDFIKRVQKRIYEKDETVWVTKRRLHGLLEACLEELPDIPFYYHVMKDFGTVLKSSLMKVVVLRSAIINAGYRVSSSHATTDVLKTDAPINVIWDIFRSYLKENVNLEKTDKSTPKYAIMSDVQGDTNCNFEIATDVGWSKLRAVLRFPTLPENWGPKAAARMQINGNIELEAKSDRKNRKRGMTKKQENQLSKRGRIRENKRLKRLKKKENCNEDEEASVLTEDKDIEEQLD